MDADVVRGVAEGGCCLAVVHTGRSACRGPAIQHIGDDCAGSVVLDDNGGREDEVVQV